MDIAIKNLINNISQEIIDIFKIEMPIKNIDAVVEVLGGSIQTDTKLYNSGILKMGNRFVIILPMFTNERHRRFAIAQQLGHLYLHMSRGDMEHWNRLKDNTLYEPTDIKEIYQANEFATAFLMPKNHCWHTLSSLHSSGSPTLSAGQKVHIFSSTALPLPYSLSQ